METVYYVYDNKYEYVLLPGAAHMSDKTLVVAVKCAYP